MKKIKNSIIVVLLMIMFDSCLKDKPFLDVSGTQPIIEFSATNGVGSLDTLNIASQSFSLTPPLTQHDTAIALNIASPEVLNHDVTVTVALNSKLVDTLNYVNGSAYESLPDSLFTVPSYTVTIPAGYRIGRFKISLKLANYDFANHAYAIGFTIMSAPGLIISGNANSFVWTLDVRNKYDGIYTVTGSTLRAGDAAKTGPFKAFSLNLITAGVSSVSFGSLQQWADGTGVGIGNPILTLTETGPLYPVAIESSGGAFNDPNYTSVYDPTKKTFYVSFSWGAGPSARLATDTIVYKGPRP